MRVSLPHPAPESQLQNQRSGNGHLGIGYLAAYLLQRGHEVSGLYAKNSTVSDETIRRHLNELEPQLLPQASRRNRWPLLVGFFLFFGVVVLLQWRSGAYHAELGSHPDEAAHYVTGLMFSDWFRTLNSGPPQEFARQFYAHYPRVAIGHWPPFYYILQGLWAMVFGSSIPSILLLQALIFALLATTFASIVLRTRGFAIAVSAGLLLLAIPIVTRSSGMIMADGLVSLLMLSAAVFFDRFLNGTLRIENALLFGLFTSFAMLTKGNGIALVVVVFATLLLLGRWNVLASPGLWISCAVVVVLCGPWYWLNRNLHTNGWEAPLPNLNYLFHAAAYYSRSTLNQLGLLGATLAVFGLVRVLASLGGARQTDRFGVIMLSLYIGVIAVTLFVPNGVEGRFALPALAALIYFLVIGACAAADWVSSSSRFLAKHRTIYISALILLVAALCFSPSHKDFSGFSAAADTIIRDASRVYPSVLIASDAPGEGMFVADMADRRSAATSVTLRGTKLLADSSWSGSDYRMRYANPAAMTELLDNIPVNYLVVDQSLDQTAMFPHQRVLQRAIVEDPGHFHMLARFSIIRNGALYPDSVVLYKVLHSKPPPRSLKVAIPGYLNSEVEVIIPESQPGVLTTSKQR